jgi:hypothetical protein
MRHLAIFSAFSLVATLAGAQENYNTAWSQHRSVFLNTTVSGAGVSGTVLNFPVLVRLGAADSATFAQARAGGVDLRFTKADNVTRLPHQIDHWDAAGRTAAVWVRVDSVKGNSSTQLIRMHWGNATAADSSNGTAVFSNGFTNVWHLGNASGVTARPNAIAGGNPATPTNFPGSYTAPRGVIGMGDTLRGGSGAAQAVLNDYLNLGTITTNYSGGFTFSVWLKPEVEGNGTTYYTASENASGTGTGGIIVIGIQGDPPGAKFRQRNATSGGNSGIINGGFGDLTGPTGVWRHLLYTKAGNSGQMDIYMNGVVAASDFGGGVADFASATRAVNQLGTTLAHMNYADDSFMGVMDEARLANTSRSADWAKLEYQNQRAAQTLVFFDSVPVSIARTNPSARNAAFSAQVSGGSVFFRLDGANPDGARLTVVDLSGRAVWRGVMAPGSNHVVWNHRDAKASAGHPLTAGVYMVRVTLMDKQGRVILAADRKLLLAR